MVHDKGFAIYRLPGETDFKFIEGPLVSINSVLNAPSGFVISKFQRSEPNHTYIIQPERYLKLGSVEGFTLPQLHFNDIDFPNIDKKNYVNRIKAAQKHLSRHFRKIVISRTFHDESILSTKAFSNFTKLAAVYERSFVYLISSEQTGTWSGASPELLISQTNGHAHTMALAGTIALTEGNEQEIVWSEKEFEEQRLVELFIEHNCNMHTVPFTKKGPLTSITGKLAHLLTRYNLEMGKDHLGRFVRDLHPTPAVCGLPKEAALNLIPELEKYTRDFYTGYLGEWQMEAKSQLFVNLRCMQYNKSHALIYAGGGITAASNPEKEWEETCNKMNSIRSVIAQ